MPTHGEGQSSLYFTRPSVDLGFFDHGYRFEVIGDLSPPPLITRHDRGDGNAGHSLTLESSGGYGWADGFSYGLLDPIKGEDWLGGAYRGSGVTIGSGETATFVFNIGGSNFNLENIEFAWRGQDWTSPDGAFNGESLKCYSGWGSEYSTGHDGDVVECTTTVTPEPVSIVLLGTGLAGIAGVGVRRRKRDRG